MSAEHMGEKGNLNTCAQALSGRAKNTPQKIASVSAVLLIEPVSSLTSPWAGLYPFASGSKLLPKVNWELGVRVGYVVGAGGHLLPHCWCSPRCPPGAGERGEDSPCCWEKSPGSIRVAPDR